MKSLSFAVLAFTAAVAVSAQQEPAAFRTGMGATAPSDTSNLPVANIGDDDLLGVTVYDAPELTRTLRVSPEGDIWLPMVKQPIHAAGLNPEDLEKAITAALIRDNVLVDPVVTVSIVETRSRPIAVVGAVRNPLTFQASGSVTLLDAISKAGGLTENAGPEILVSREAPGTDGKSTALVQRIPVHGLLDDVNPSLNLSLQGGEVIRVPEAGQVFVLGQVKKPGAFLIADGAESSVLKAVALSGGLDQHPRSTAYIYRIEGGSGGRNEIPVELKNIMNRKSPDVALEANDILYIPEATGRRISATVLGTSIGVAVALSTALLYIYH
jgi:polysaccharide export outer membrane protein